MAELSFRKESIEENWDSLSGWLWPLHWEEFAVDKDRIKLNPDRESYLTFERMGLLHLMAGRDKGLLVAYYIGFVKPSLHYRDVCTCVTDIFFVHPKYDGFGERGKMVDRLLDAGEKMLRDLGVLRVYVNTKADHPLDPIMERRGYLLTDLVWRKLLR